MHCHCNPIDERFNRIEGSTGPTFLTDFLGSTVALTGSSGTVQTSYGYDPYGNTASSGTASDNPYQFTGRLNDGAGLYYYRARYYNPTWGRFISEDPIGLTGGPNLYRYVWNNPVNYTDPRGVAPKDQKFGLPDDFWNWYHASGNKSPGDPDLNKEEADAEYAEWCRLGKPPADHKGRNQRF